MRAFTILALLPALALATIQITSPNANEYWVQNTSNTFTWTYNQGDPSLASVYLVNSNVNILNGHYSIEENLDLSKKTLTITNVTLKTGPGYTLVFTNTSNSMNDYAHSSEFEVKDAGTPPASTNPTGSSSSSSRVSPSSTSSSSTPSGTSDSAKNGALPKASNILFSLATCGFVTAASFFA